MNNRWKAASAAANKEITMNKMTKAAVVAAATCFVATVSLGPTPAFGANEGQQSCECNASCSDPISSCVAVGGCPCTCDCGPSGAECSCSSSSGF